MNAKGGLNRSIGRSVGRSGEDFRNDAERLDRVGRFEIKCCHEAIGSDVMVTKRLKNSTKTLPRIIRINDDTLISDNEKNTYENMIGRLPTKSSL